jgi:hypothetical protein
MSRSAAYADLPTRLHFGSRVKAHPASCFMRNSKLRARHRIETRAAQPVAAVQWSGMAAREDRVHGFRAQSSQSTGPEKYGDGPRAACRAYAASVLADSCVGHRATLPDRVRVESASGAKLIEVPEVRRCCLRRSDAESVSREAGRP